MAASTCTRRGNVPQIDKAAKTVNVLAGSQSMQPCCPGPAVVFPETRGTAVHVQSDDSMLCDSMRVSHVDLHMPHSINFFSCHVVNCIGRSRTHRPMSVSLPLVKECCVRLATGHSRGHTSIDCSGNRDGTTDSTRHSGGGIHTSMLSAISGSTA